MATKAQLRQYLNDPNVQAFLGMLRDAEGTNQTGNPYQTRFGGKVDTNLDLTKYPTFEYKQFTQTDGKKNVSGAVGAYQFITKTWRGLANQYGFNDFSPETQDMAAVALLVQNGALPAVLKGDFNTAVKKSNKTWASLPGSPYAQHTRSNDYVKKSLQKHSGLEVAYDGVNSPKYLPVGTKAKQATTSPVETAKTETTTVSQVTVVKPKKTLWQKIKSIFSRATK